MLGWGKSHVRPAHVARVNVCRWISQLVQLALDYADAETAKTKYESRTAARETKHSTITSGLFSAANAVHFDLARFAEFVELYCVELLPGGSVSVNYGAAEKYLVSHYLAGKPFFTLNEREMIYTSSFDDETGAVQNSDIQVRASRSFWLKFLF